MPVTYGSMRNGGTIRESVHNSPMIRKILAIRVPIPKYLAKLSFFQCQNDRKCQAKNRINQKENIVELDSGKI